MDSIKTNPTDPELRSSRSNYGEIRPLNLRRKIFLSHSGKDKNFVRFLHKELCHQYRDVRFVFFDEESLPIAVPISMENILTEAMGCELGVLVLSEDFFTHTPNPMLELEALITKEVRLLPLFYKISVDVFNKMRREYVWDKRWKEWTSVVDEQRIEVWRHALSLVNIYSGLEFCKLATNELDYIIKIVNKVTGIIRPAISFSHISFSEEGVCGRDRLCKIVDNMYNECALNRSSADGGTQVAFKSANVGCEEDSCDQLDLVGIYGFAGLGKTTLCKCLCDFYLKEFHGKVCWIDLGAIPSDRASSQTHSSDAFFIRMQYLISKISGYIDGVHSLTFSQVQNLLKNLIRKNPIFLAIDNILPDLGSREEADFYLSCEFPKGSKIFITSRSENILNRVTSEHTRFSVVIEHIPNLKLKEAWGIFVHEIRTRQILNVEDDAKECVNMCIINHEWYHPLMLKSLAASIRHDRRGTVDLKSRLRELQSAAVVDESDAWKTVFNMLDITYAVLSEEAQKVFLDLALFYRKSSCKRRHCYAWIQALVFGRYVLHHLQT